ncbi:MAG: hypothetical protein ABSC22_21135 [Roseiarcus sp.]
MSIMKCRASFSSMAAGASRPRSATDGLVALSGLAGFVGALSVLLAFRPFADPAYSALTLIAGVAGGVFAVDLLWARVHRRRTTGLDFSRWSPSPARLVVKFAGLLASFGVVAALYALFPEYWRDFYARYFHTVGLATPFVFLLAIPYIYCIDAVMIAPEDGLWHLGSLVLLRFDRVNRAVAWQHLLGWLVKGFFLPLMFTYACMNFEGLASRAAPNLHSFKSIYDWSYEFLYFIDVVFATSGYVFSLRLTDTHLRSAEPTAVGWAAALICYEPFWGLIGAKYLAYDVGRPWGEIMWDHPILYAVWGTSILALVVVYVWATIMFGCRFSNLTHRGVLTNGPYRFTKHPAYISKNLSWWLISLPFMTGGVLAGMRNCLLLLILNGIYVIRAWTEERHLRRDPDYVAYAHWMEENGLFRFLASWGKTLADFAGQADRRAISRRR